MTHLLSRDQIRTALNNQKLNCLVQGVRDPTTCIKHGNDTLICAALAIADAQSQLDQFYPCEKPLIDEDDLITCEKCGDNFSTGLCIECHANIVSDIESQTGEQRFI